MTPRETAVRIIRLYVRTEPDQRHNKMMQVMTEGHGPALFTAIEEIGMLSPLVEEVTGKTGQEAFTLSQQIITAAANANLFPRDETGAVIYPSFRPVGEYGKFLEAVKSKSVLDLDDPQDLFSAFNVPPI